MSKKKNNDNSQTYNQYDTTWFKDGDFKNHILNEKNKPITKQFIEGIFKKYGFSYKVKHLETFQLAMIHISYLNRTALNDKTAKILKDVVPIENKLDKKIMPLVDKGYNRLEYKGDALIHLILAEYLFLRYENEEEGFLTKLRVKIERSEMLSRLSKILGLHEYAVVARNIEQSGGRMNNTHLTEDIFEAFFGALFSEAPYEICRDFLVAIIEKEIDIAELIDTEDNYKDQLMQHYHQLKWTEPEYCEDVSQRKNIKEGCSEIKSFITYVKNSSGDIIGVGEGNSKIRSEQLAAYNALVTLGAINNNDDDKNSDYYGSLSSDSEKEPMKAPKLITKPKKQPAKKNKSQTSSSSSSSNYFEE